VDESVAFLSVCNGYDKGECGLLNIWMPVMCQLKT
jgi:hypothetical protein